jgi:hypothetical protein
VTLFNTLTFQKYLLLLFLIKKSRQIVAWDLIVLRNTIVTLVKQAVKAHWWLADRSCRLCTWRSARQLRTLQQQKHPAEHRLLVLTNAILEDKTRWFLKTTPLFILLLVMYIVLCQRDKEKNQFLSNNCLLLKEGTPYLSKQQTGRRYVARNLSTPLSPIWIYLPFVTQYFMRNIP